MAAAAPVLSVQNLNIQLSTSSKCEDMPFAVENVYFEIQQGSVYGLIGGSGSGKTLTCMSIMNLRESSVHISGSIRLCGRELLSLKESHMQRVRGRQVGMIVQNPMSAFHPAITIGEHFVDVMRSHAPVSKKAALEKALHYLQLVKLDHPERLLHMYPFQFSGGMLQRVMIAMVLCLEPVLVIADEPTTALDTTNQRDILELLAELRSSLGLSLLLVSHDLGVICRLADDVGVMRQGQLVEQQPVEQLLKAPMHDYTKHLLEAAWRLEGGECL
ncbi:ABC transporter ATP-binding protein [Paenibacillus aquistagni]|nr:ABC transporter ATP-binding protein [Paenibacillus aquistagni]